MRVIQLFATLLVASFAACASPPNHAERGCSAAGGHAAAATIAQTLSRLASAVRDQSFLEPRFYTSEHLTCVFGAYTFTRQSSPIADVQVGFSDPAGVVNGSGAALIESGTLSLRLPKDGHTGFSVFALVRPDGPRLPIQTVIEVLGEPARVTDASPKPGHLPWPPTKEKHGLENAVATFDVTTSSYSSQIWVMTDDAGTVLWIRAGGDRRVP